MPRLTPYGISNFERIISKNFYYIDKTAYIEKLEQYNAPVFLRPRRFGKSLFTETLRWYYDIKAKSSFDRLFGKLYIGQNPTGSQNSYFFLSLNFSGMGAWVEGDPNFVKKQFDSHILTDLSSFARYYGSLLDMNDSEIRGFADRFSNDAAGGLKDLIKRVGDCGGKLYIVIDEYDSLTNALSIYYKGASSEDNEYLNILRKGGFFRAFFEAIKLGTSSSVERIFITGILPITLADMNSGFNIAQWVTFDKNLANMLGITESELGTLLDEVYADYPIDIMGKDAVKSLLRRYYDGYRFGQKAENAYNPMMVMYFLNSLIQNELPVLMADTNLRIDYNQIAYLFGNNHTERDAVITAVTETGSFPQSRTLQVSFDMNSYRDGQFIPEGLFYSGILTFDDYAENLAVPNLVTREFVLGYFSKIMNFNANTLMLNDITQAYREQGDVGHFVERFFARAIQSFPGDFFKNANESFYHGLMFYILWNAFAKDRYEVLPEYQLVSGQCDLMLCSRPGARVRCQINDLFELKRLPKSAKDSDMDTLLQAAAAQMRGYLAGSQQSWRGVCVVFRGNTDYKMAIL